MKRMSYKRKLLSCSVITSVVFSSFLIYSPANFALSAPVDPVLEVQSPVADPSTEEAKVELTGNVSGEVTQQDSSTSELGQENRTTTTSTNVTSGMESVLTENSNEQNILENSTLSTQDRPSIVDIKLFAYDQQPIVEPYQPADHYGNLNESDKAHSLENYVSAIDKDGKVKGANLTQVRLNSQIIITFSENVKILDDKGKLVLPLLFVSYKNSETGEDVSVEMELISYDKEKFQAIVAPVMESPTELWKPSATYEVFVNPEIKDEDNLSIITKSFKFTTRPLMHSADVHGGYRNNTNSCANCHSTHNGEDSTLAGGKFGNDPDGVCMACHDGTAGSPMVDNYDDENNQHDTMHEVTKTEGYSCASCHNPHTNWTAENPNKIKRTYEENKTTIEISYKRSPGLSADFNLCLRCHKDAKASNINKYFEDEDILASSGHIFSIEDGSTVNGQMACADCHETHGGKTNVYSLKENLGHTKRADTDLLKLGKKVEWTGETERTFCTKCHFISENDTVKSVEMYGKTASFNTDTVGHRPIEDKTVGCSTCHGGASETDPIEQIRRSAHAPLNKETVKANQ